MALLVNFVAVENKTDIVNTDKYVANIYNCLLERELPVESSTKQNLEVTQKTNNS